MPSPNPLVAVVLLSLCSIAMATEDVPKKAKGEWVITNGVGTASTPSSSIRIRQDSTQTLLNYHNVRWHSEADQDPPLYSFRALYWPSPEAEIGYGFEFFHLKLLANPNQTVNVSGQLNGVPYNQNQPIGTTLQKFTATNGLNMFQGVVVHRKRFQTSESFPSGKLQAYWGLGVGVAMPHPITRFMGSDPYGDYELDGFCWQALAGFEVRVNPKLGLFLEYKYTDYKATFDLRDGAVGSARFRTSYLGIGTSIRF